MVEPLPLLVYSHLRWDSVFQRPHQLMSRIARRRRVLFVEEPLLAPQGNLSWELIQGEAGLQICRPRSGIERAGFHALQLPTLIDLAWRLLAQEGISRHMAWLYTPMALPLARALEPAVLAYDCMDELSAFLGAPPELQVLEAELLRCCDVAFAGGRSLYRAKRELQPRVHCFPSSVDARHFGAARSGAEEHPDQRALPRPRLGFFGVIDERIDRALLAALADARPDWQIALVGPVVKIDPALLPRRPNLHYLGRRSYQELPSFLAGWDVCLLPFARNEATRFISPTKTLEYMAAELPIASTPIADVVEPYGDIVYLGESASAFTAACERALAAGPAERELRAARMRAVLEATSWDATAEAMERELQASLRRRERTAPARPRAQSLALGAARAERAPARHPLREPLS